MRLHRRTHVALLYALVAALYGCASSPDKAEVKDGVVSWTFWGMLVDLWQGIGKVGRYVVDFVGGYVIGPIFGLPPLGAGAATLGGGVLHDAMTPPPGPQNIYNNTGSGSFTLNSSAGGLMLWKWLALSFIALYYIRNHRWIRLIFSSKSKGLRWAIFMHTITGRANPEISALDES